MSSSESPYDPAQPVYLRIGDWHESETSRKYSTGETEAGVSVYDLGPDGSIVVPEREWSLKDLILRLRSPEPKHLVQGEWVGSGGEDEPVLKNIVVVGSWPDDLPNGFKSSILEFTDENMLSVEEALGGTVATSPAFRR